MECKRRPAVGSLNADGPAGRVGGGPGRAVSKHRTGAGGYHHRSTLRGDGTAPSGARRAEVRQELRACAADLVLEYLGPAVPGARRHVIIRAGSPSSAVVTN